MSLGVLNPAMVADAAALHVRQSYDLTGWGGLERPGKVPVSYGAWVRPPPGLGYSLIAPPDKMRASMRSGELTRAVERGPGRLYRFQYSWRSPDRYYADSRLLTQCVEGSGETRCISVARRGDWSFGFIMDDAQINEAAGLLERIEKAIETTRGACPARSSPNR